MNVLDGNWYFRISPRFSIGFKSGDWLGQSMMSIFVATNQSIKNFEVSFGSFTCWKVHSNSISSSPNGSIMISNAVLIVEFSHSVPNKKYRTNIVQGKTAPNHNFFTLVFRAFLSEANVPWDDGRLFWFTTKQLIDFLSLHSKFRDFFSPSGPDQFSMLFSYRKNIKKTALSMRCTQPEFVQSSSDCPWRNHIWYFRRNCAKNAVRTFSSKNEYITITSRGCFICYNASLCSLLGF